MEENKEIVLTDCDIYTLWNLICFLLRIDSHTGFLKNLYRPLEWLIRLRFLSTPVCNHNETTKLTHAMERICYMMSFFIHLNFVF